MNFLNKIALTQIKGIGPRLSRSLLAHCGSIENLFSLSKKDLLDIPGIREPIANSIVSKTYLTQAEKELRFIEKNKIKVLWLGDEDYPSRLKHCEDAPVVLYSKGSENLNPATAISIVGTRNATSYGKKIVEELVSGLKGFDTQIISGLAYGIDIHTHRHALLNNIPTLGILAHGLDRIYPVAHEDVASRMINFGGLLTEFPSGTTPERPHFPMRNRIIAGLADVTIVVEAAHRGGALITAEIANSYSRDVCAFPGGVDQEYSAGCNYLIKTNRAHLIRNTDDLFYLMNWSLEKTTSQSKQLSLLPLDLSKDELKVYTILQDLGQTTVDDIALHCNWPQSKLAIILLEMEMKDAIVALPGKVFKLL